MTSTECSKLETGKQSLVQGPLLVGLRRDESSDAAVKRSVELARLFDADVDYVHAVEKALTSISPRAILDELRGELRDLLVQAGERMRPDAPNLLLSPDRVADSILEHAQRRSSGLLVLGPHVKRGLVDLGGTSRALLERAECPVWSEPEGELRPIRRILVPVDLSDDSREAVRWASRLAEHLDAELTLLHVHLGVPAVLPPAVPGAHRMTPPMMADDQRAAVAKELGAFVRETAPDAEVLLRTGDVVDELLEEHTDHDLVVMAVKGRGAVASVLLGSVALGLLRSARRPVVALRRPAAETPA